MPSGWASQGLWTFLGTLNACVSRPHGTEHTSTLLTANGPYGQRVRGYTAIGPMLVQVNQITDVGWRWRMFAAL